MLEATTSIEQVGYLTIHYPAGFSGNSTPVDVLTKRFSISVSDASGDTRHLVAYLTNAGVKPEKTDLIFFLNGHYSCFPSQQELGLIGPSATGAVIAQLAIKGYSVVTFDDRDQGESTHSAYPQPVDCSIPPAGTGQLYGNKGLIWELDDLRAVEKTLLLASSENTALNHPWHSIHVVGLSGGGVRAAHFMMISRSPVLSSTYIATPGTQEFWMQLEGCSTLDTSSSPHCPNKTIAVFNGDTYDFTFLSNFTYSDLLLAGLDRKLHVVFAFNKRESGEIKNWFWKETVPALAAHGIGISPSCGRVSNKASVAVLHVGGDDPCGVGPKNTGTGFCHEYYMRDLFTFLRASGNPPPEPIK
ncbi:MAG TPA: hypothetical protein VN310_15440 [Candidatus Dormibacteraeota bacterium]|nr:hypothetical protein [Candidatus Dormibacteraeota bacterium]